MDGETVTVPTTPEGWRLFRMPGAKTAARSLAAALRRVLASIPDTSRLDHYL